MAPSGQMILIQHAGQIAAIATTSKIRFADHLADLPDAHPDRRHVYAMALYARDVLTGALEGPYTDEDAELYARTVLEDRDE